jgi:hypothetical protein
MMQRTKMIRRNKHAFTLLEVVLTLSMAVVLMALVGSTLQFYAVNMTVRDTDVRRVHLASSILQMIADDLRASLYGTTFDPSTLESFLAASVAGQAQSAAAALDPAAADTLGIESASDGSTLSDTLATDSTDLIASTMTLTKPGMIGNQFQIQFDISRLPRLEQWAPTLSATPGVMADVPSDIKTVTYYVQAPGTIAGVVDPLQGYLPTPESGSQAAGGGLVRRELDRAASNWATESGGLTGLMMTGDLIAAEVTSISFEYFDGIIWQLFWNSDEVASMPKAIRITLTMSDPNGPTDLAALTAGVTPGTRTFTHTVMLPVGSVATTSSTDTMGETATSPATTTGGTGTTATTGGSL